MAIKPGQDQFGISKPETNTPYNFSKTDNAILFGAETSKDLVELVVQCGFVLQDGGHDILDVIGIKQLNYKTALKTAVFHSKTLLPITSIIESWDKVLYNL